MEFRINKNSRVIYKHNRYELIITFMHGDADGFEDVVLAIPEDIFNNVAYKDRIKRFVSHILSAIELDSDGRCGFDNSIDLKNWYKNGRVGAYIVSPKLGVMHWDEFYDVPETEDSDTLLAYQIPCQMGWYASYDRLKMVYYDDKGIRYDVDIII